MNEKILAIGIGWEQLPLVEKIKEMGYKSIVTTEWDKDKIDADEIYSVKSRDLIKLDEIYKKESPIAIVSDECDYSMFAVAYLTDKYNLPGPSLDSLIITNNKYLQRENAKISNISQPDYKLCNTYNEVIDACEEIGYPAMLKPVDNRGSIGIKKVFAKKDIKNMFYQTIANSHSRQILVEKMINGEVVTVEGIYSDRFYNLTFSTKKMHPMYPENAMHLQYPGALSKSIVEKMYDINYKLIDSIGITYGLTHSEFIIDGEDIYFLEIANRGGGVHISNKIVPSITGIDITTFLIKKSLGEKVDIEESKNKTKNRYSMLHFFDFGAGYVEEICGVDNALKIQDVMDIRINFVVGDHIGNISTSLKRPGFVIVSSPTKKRCVDSIKNVEDMINVKIRDKKTR